MTRDVYRVTVKDAQPVRTNGGGHRRRLHARHEVPVGQWQEIAYWLDQHGFIEADYLIEIRIAEVEVDRVVV
jgi:hypothetical protein